MTSDDRNGVMKSFDELDPSAFEPSAESGPDSGKSAEQEAEMAEEPTQNEPVPPSGQLIAKKGCRVNPLIIELMDSGKADSRAMALRIIREVIVACEPGKTVKQLFWLNGKHTVSEAVELQVRAIVAGEAPVPGESESDDAVAESEHEASNDEVAAGVHEPHLNEWQEQLIDPVTDARDAFARRQNLPRQGEWTPDEKQIYHDWNLCFRQLAYELIRVGVDVTSDWDYEQIIKKSTEFKDHTQPEGEWDEIWANPDVWTKIWLGRTAFHLISDEKSVSESLAAFTWPWQKTPRVQRQPASGSAMPAPLAVPLDADSATPADDGDAFEDADSIKPSNGEQLDDIEQELVGVASRWLRLREEKGDPDDRQVKAASTLVGDVLRRIIRERELPGEPKQIVTQAKHWLRDAFETAEAGAKDIALAEAVANMPALMPPSESEEESEGRTSHDHDEAGSAEPTPEPAPEPAVGQPPQQDAEPARPHKVTLKGKGDQGEASQPHRVSSQGKGTGGQAPPTPKSDEEIIAELSDKKLDRILDEILADESFTCADIADVEAEARRRILEEIR